MSIEKLIFWLILPLAGCFSLVNWLHPQAAASILSMTSHKKRISNRFSMQYFIVGIMSIKRRFSSAKKVINKTFSRCFSSQNKPRRHSLQAELGAFVLLQLSSSKCRFHHWSPSKESLAGARRSKNKRSLTQLYALTHCSFPTWWRSQTVTYPKVNDMML